MIDEDDTAPEGVLEAPPKAVSTESMIERAAKAIFVTEGHTAPDLELPAMAVAKARAAILAALDPKDDALVEMMAREIAMYGTSHFGDDTPFDQQPVVQRAMRMGEARAALSALRASASVEDLPPQDNHSKESL